MARSWEIPESRHDGVLGHDVANPVIWVSSVSNKKSKEWPTVDGCVAIDFRHQQSDWVEALCCWNSAVAGSCRKCHSSCFGKSCLFRGGVWQQVRPPKELSGSVDPLFLLISRAACSASRLCECS